MSYKKALTIQDISCVGQCSMTVALPIISACGHETCILPSAVLSTHTCGFISKNKFLSNYTLYYLLLKDHFICIAIEFCQQLMQ